MLMVSRLIILGDAEKKKSTGTGKLCNTTVTHMYKLQISVPPIVQIRGIHPVLSV